MPRSKANSEASAPDRSEREFANILDSRKVAPPRASIVRGTSISRTGLVGALWGFVVFLLPRLWIGIAYLNGDGAETDESLSDFWEFLVVSIAYLPAVVASIAAPRAARWIVLLTVAGVTQWLTFPLHDAQPWMGMVQLWALPATFLLLLGAGTSFRSWREVRAGDSDTER